MLNFRTKFYRMRMVFRLMQDFPATHASDEKPNFSQWQRNQPWSTRPSETRGPSSEWPKCSRAMDG